jgi:hypothetical protein
MRLSTSVRVVPALAVVLTVLGCQTDASVRETAKLLSVQTARLKSSIGELKAAQDVLAEIHGRKEEDSTEAIRRSTRDFTLLWGPQVEDEGSDTSASRAVSRRPWGLNLELILLRAKVHANARPGQHINRRRWALYREFTELVAEGGAEFRSELGRGASSEKKPKSRIQVPKELDAVARQLADLASEESLKERLAALTAFANEFVEAEVRIREARAKEAEAAASEAEDDKKEGD